MALPIKKIKYDVRVIEIIRDWKVGRQLLN
jgi:hypothetical protein